MSSFSLGQMNQLGNSLEAAGFTADDVTKLGQFDDLVGVRELVRGRRQLTEPPLLTTVHTFATSSAKPTMVEKSFQFKGWFDGVDEGERSAELTLHKLERPSLDVPIIAALGGEEVAEVSLADFFSALAEKEAVGDFTWVIAYVKDNEGVLRAVFADWSGVGWDVYACSVDDPREWDGGHRVLSRD